MCDTCPGADTLTLGDFRAAGFSLAFLFDLDVAPTFVFNATAKFSLVDASHNPAHWTIIIIIIITFSSSSSSIFSYWQ